MSRLYYLYCHHCGEPLKNRKEPYCPACNIYLCYRAMPFLLGMILTGRLATDLASSPPPLNLWGKVPPAMMTSGLSSGNDEPEKMNRGGVMFESQYNDEMEAEVRQLEARQRARDAGHPEWANACTVCGCELRRLDTSTCERCRR